MQDGVNCLKEQYQEIFKWNWFAAKNQLRSRSKVAMKSQWTQVSSLDRKSKFTIKHVHISVVHTHMLVLLVCCKVVPHIVLTHWAVWTAQFFDFLYKITTQVSWRFYNSKRKISDNLPSINSWISSEKVAMIDSEIQTPFCKYLLRMIPRVKALVAKYNLLAHWH